MNIFFIVFSGRYFRYHSHEFSEPKVVRLPERGVQSAGGEGGGAGLARADPRNRSGVQAADFWVCLKLGSPMVPPNLMAYHGFSHFLKTNSGCTPHSPTRKYHILGYFW